jgi:signal transduction histidine kinase
MPASRLISYLFGMALMLGALLSPTIALATDHITDRAYVEDPSGQLTLNEAMAKPATEFSGLLSKGFTQSAFWIRLRIDPQTENAAAATPLILKIQPAYLDEILLFDPLTPDKTGRVTGDRYDWRLSEFKSLNHNFIIPTGSAPRTVWLRLKTTSTSLMHIEALSIDDAQSASRLQEMAYGLVMGLLIMFCIWALIQWWINRDRMMAVFVLSQCIALIYSAAYVGYARIVLAGTIEPASIDIFNSVVFCTYVAVGLLFHHQFLQEFRPSRLGLHVFISIMFISFPLELALIASDHVQQALRLNIVVASFIPIYVLLLAMSSKVWGELPVDEQPAISKRGLLGFYGFVLVTLLLASMPTLGFTRAPEFALHLYLIHGLMTGVILIILLQVRAVRTEKSRHAILLKAQASVQQVDIEKQKSQLQSRFVEMLAHELKTSLSVLQMVLSLPKADEQMKTYGKRTIQNVNDLIERCLQAEKIEDDQFISHFENFYPVDVLDELVDDIPDAERLTIERESGVVIHSDWQMFKTALSNLIENALKYSPEQSKVFIQIKSVARERGPGCEIIIDNAVETVRGASGFPDPDELFKKYYRADSARKHSGSGIGLYLVSNFMRHIGGEVNYEALDNRVRFSLWLPS